MRAVWAHGRFRVPVSPDSQALRESFAMAYNRDLEAVRSRSLECSIFCRDNVRHTRKPLPKDGAFTSSIGKELRTRYQLVDARQEIGKDMPRIARCLQPSSRECKYNVVYAACICSMNMMDLSMPAYNQAYNHNHHTRYIACYALS